MKYVVAILVTVFAWSANAKPIASQNKYPRVDVLSVTPPTLIFPVNDSLNAPERLTCTWQKVVGALSYDLQIGTDSNFSTITVSQNTSSDTKVVLLNFNTLYFWRVRANDATTNSEWSETRKFRTHTNNFIPPPPTLYTPARFSAFNSIDSFAYSWGGTVNTEGYIVQLYSDSLMSKKVAEYRTGSEYFIVPPEAKVPHTTYWWRVRACNPVDACGGWTQTWQYSINPTSSVKIESLIPFVTVFPNPANETFTVFSGSRIIEDVCVYNLYGEKIRFRSELLKDSSVKISLLPEGISVGVYFIEVSLETGEKVIKKITVK